MKFAWTSPELERLCVSGVRLRAVADGQAEAAEDLLHLVRHAPRFGDLMTFRSVQIDVSAGDLALLVEEVEMRVRPLSPDGVPRVVLSRAALPDHSSLQALLVQDFYVRGRSILRPAI